MTFEIKDKVALVTGGASGIGLHCVKALLRHGLRGVTIADINVDLGQKVVGEIEREFGPNKAIFCVTDVTDYKNLEDAFKRTIEQFKNIDILINNAGIMNEVLWAKTVAINFNGVLHGMLLGYENYIQNYKSGSEGVIVNLSSVAATPPLAASPIYTATKAGVLGASKAWGDEAHYERTKIKVICICPGATETPILPLTPEQFLTPAYEEMFKTIKFPTQKPEHLGNSISSLIKNAKTGSIWVIEGGEEPYEYILPPRENFKVKK